MQPHSGSNANIACYLALLEPGDKILGMELSHGGHLTHGSPVNFSGRFFEFLRYGVSGADQRIDYDEVRRLAREHRPKMIQTGYSAYSRTIDFEAFGAIAREVGAVLFADIAHIAGLVAAGVHPSPVGQAGVVATTTHKTLRGPRGGMILCDQEHAEAIDKAVFPHTQGGPLEHVIAAKAVAFAEAMRPDFKDYAAQIVRNARALAETLLARGLDARLGRHRQPPVRDRPDRARDLGQEGAGHARPRRHHDLEEHGARREALALAHERPAHRHARGHHARHARGGDGADRRLDRRRARSSRDEASLAARIRGQVAELGRRFPLPYKPPA